MLDGVSEGFMKFVQLTELDWKDTDAGLRPAPGQPIILQLSNVIYIRAATIGTNIEFVGGSKVTVSEPYDEVKQQLGL